MKVYFFILLSARKLFGEWCQALHATAPGLDLVCCSSTNKLPANCQHEALCTEDECVCYLNVTQELSCSLEKTALPSNALWLDHSRQDQPMFRCSNPNFPNPYAEYHVKMLFVNERICGAFLYGLSGYNVVSLVLTIVNDDANLHPTFLTALLEYFPNLRSLHFEFRTPRMEIFLTDDKISAVQVVRMHNVNIKFSDEAAAQCKRLERLHIENTTLDNVPKWFLDCQNLTKLVIDDAKLKSLKIISEMNSLTTLKITQNRIKNLSGIEFACHFVQDINLSYNQIERFGTHTFAKCKALRVLSLRGNPLESLPYRAFRENHNLRWLDLSNTQIKIISTNHFIGLHSLRTLILSSTPIFRIAQLAFAPLKSLQMLKLDDCNLTEIPIAATYCCNLTSLHLSRNSFYESRSLAPERMAALSHISALTFDRNPLYQLPIGFFLLPISNQELLSHILDTLVTLPLWHREPCVGYFWNIHLKNSSHALFEKVSQWNSDRMKHSNMEHCNQLYHKMMDKLLPYKELAYNNFCTAVRSERHPLDKSQNLTRTGRNVLGRISSEPPKKQLFTVLFVSVVGNLILLTIVGIQLICITARCF